MELFCREYGKVSEKQSSLIFLHGLLGSSANWHSIAKRLANSFHILVPDLRNHGRSPHSDDVGYPAIEQDLIQLFDRWQINSAILIGHSMGGKAAMLLALNNPERVESLAVVDMAPVTYQHRFETIYTALRAIDLDRLESRTQAVKILGRHLSNPEVWHYLLQNLVKKEQGWSWRVNLDALIAGMEQILSFPEINSRTQFMGKTIFIYGSDSDYVSVKYEKDIKVLFPLARLRIIPSAGHWVYSEQPEAFIAALNSFLN